MKIQTNCPDSLINMDSPVKACFIALVLERPEKIPGVRHRTDQKRHRPTFIKHAGVLDFQPRVLLYPLSETIQFDDFRITLPLTAF